MNEAKFKRIQCVDRAPDIIEAASRGDPTVGEITSIENTASGRRVEFGSASGIGLHNGGFDTNYPDFRRPCGLRAVGRSTSRASRFRSLFWDKAMGCDVCHSPIFCD